MQHGLSGKQKFVILLTFILNGQENEEIKTVHGKQYAPTYQQQDILSFGHLCVRPYH